MANRIRLLLAAPIFLLGCTSSPRSQDIVRRTTAVVTRTIASDAKGAALGVRDGLRHDPNDDAVDINIASKDTLEGLPGLTPQMAGDIVANRPYRHTSDLVRRRILPKRAYDKVSSRLVAH